MELNEINRRNYGKPPTLTKIQSVIKKSGMSMRRFEKFFGIPENTLKRVLKGKRPLPAKYWHIFYERRAAKFLRVFKIGMGENVGTILGAIGPKELLNALPEDRRAELVLLIKSMDMESVLTQSMKTESAKPDAPSEPVNITHDALQKFKK